MNVAVTKKRRSRALKTSSTKRKLTTKKLASTLRVVPLPPRTVSEPKDEDDDRDERRWLDW